MGNNEEELLKVKISELEIELTIQKRELEIEAALERVRSRTMAMQKSEELAEAAAVLFQQFAALGNEPDRISIGIIDEESGTTEVWATDQTGTQINIRFTARNTEPTTVQPLFESWKAGKPSLVVDLQGNELKKWIHYLRTELGMSINDNYFHDRRLHHVSFFSQGWLNISTLEPLPDQTLVLLDRFASVFNLTYTRFLDLQKAEIQVQEAKIEAALERVRARAMSMQNSEDVASATAVMFTELFKLGIETMRCGILFIHENKTMEVWNSYTDKEGEIRKVAGLLDMNIHPLLQQAFIAWQNKDETFRYKLEGEDRQAYYAAVSQSPTYHLPVYNEPQETHYSNIYLFEEGGIYTFTQYPHSTEVQSVLKKFTAVFSLTFRRYQDLKRAEAQAREAQIQLALERVRARTMAMQQSEELAETASVVFKQLTVLGIDTNRLYIGIIKDESGNIEFWGTDEDGSTVNTQFTGSISKNKSIQKMYDGWNAQKKSIIIDMQGKELSDYVQYLIEELHVPFKQGLSQTRRVQTIAYFSKGFLGIASPDEQPEANINLLERFAGVFNLTFTRFLDLKNAEAQTREARIETALERVRSKAMSMHSSEDIVATIGVFYHELEHFNITPRRCGVGLLNKETRYSEISSMNTTEEGNSIEVIGRLKMGGHPVLEGVFDNWLLQKEYHPVLRGNEIKEYYQLVRPQISYPDYPNDTVQYGYFFFFTEGGVYAWTENPLSEEDLKIYRRFTSVLSLTYKRYKDLKDAEARTQIAVKEASLDRVRAEIASMRNAEDLQRITPLVWRELTALGVPFFRCGVFIVDEEKQKIYFYLSTPDGKSLAALNLDADTTDIISNATTHWREQKVYISHWSKEQFLEFAQNLVSQGQIQNVNTYQGGEEAPESLTLQFVPFIQGMMYVGSAEDLSTVQIELVQALAEAFSTAYARYEDFTKLEAANQQIESALKDLRATQTQLIQSEKMASLGELTAGIAHEIQNPLNFVNNFSEVSTELVDEMNEALAKGNTGEAQQIAEDLKQNLEKINHHGKRAGDIVKGMLQHSRSSSGTKEPTDINALADEYLRLAYHGLRAKDKSFNASMKTGFD
ncbi:MAG: histidine kinase dimerization/phospho-acceptor domain-containing protein, partial [Sediminibacterium sp.]|nr:histidine kinase dimerization/phospho-acceptor domain-containing protein [Sediminibacterium sp.]